MLAAAARSPGRHCAAPPLVPRCGRGASCCRWRRRFLASSAATGGSHASRPPTMKFASAVTHCEQWVEHRDASAVVDGIIDQLDEQLDGQAPDLLIFFNASSPMVPLHGRDVAQELRERCAARWETSSPVVLGASWGSGGPGTGVIGGPARTTGCHEIQESAALTVLGASLPSVKVMPFFANPDHDSLPTLIGGSWAELALLPEAETPHVILFSDPSQFGLGPYSDTILKYFDNALPFSTKVGGLVPGGGLISLDYQGCKTAVGTQGVGGVVLQGDIEVDTLVCQGAAPFGPVFEVTACQGPTVFGLDGEPAAKKVIDMLEQGRQRRAAAGQAAAAAAPPPNDSATGEAGQAAAGGAAAAAEQWEADDGLDAEEEYDWDIEPENTLHILAGVEVDGNPTRGELDLPSVSTDGGEEALSEKGSQHRGSVRISSDYVVRHIVQVRNRSLSLRTFPLPVKTRHSHLPRQTRDTAEKV
jgi:small ligand-binding sensory domain FIST